MNAVNISMTIIQVSNRLFSGDSNAINNVRKTQETKKEDVDEWMLDGKK